MRTLLLMLLTVALIGWNAAEAPAQAGPEPIDALVARTLQAYGGDSLPRHDRMFRVTGRNWSNRRAAEGAVLRELRWPDYLRVEIAYEDGGRESRLLVGDDGWHNGAPAPAPLVDAMRLQAARLALPMLLGWESEQLRDLGEAQLSDGTEVRRLAVDLTEAFPSGPGGELTLFVEIRRADARILRSAGVMKMGGEEVSFGAAYEEFGPFAALSWPRRENQSAMGQPTGWTTIEAIEVDLPLERDLIRP